MKINFFLLIFYQILTITVNCYHQPSAFSGKQSMLLLRGLTNIFWDYIDSNQLNTINVSTQCELSLNQLNQALRNNQEWPLIMLDASSRFPVDSLGTGYSDYGDFDQCLQFNWVNHDSSLIIKGQHCTISLLPTLNQSQWSINPFTRNKVINDDLGLVPQLGICLPSTCSKSDLKNILIKVLDSVDWKLLSINQCKLKTTLLEEVINSNLVQKIALIILLSIVLINLNCTWYHWWLNKSQSHWSRHFSLINSYNSLIVDNPIARNTFLTKLSIIVHLYSIGIHAIIWFLTGIGWGLFANSVFLMKNRTKWWTRSSPDYFAEILYFYGGITHSFTLWKVTGPSTPIISSFKHMIIKMFSITINIIPLACLMIIMPIIITGPLNYNLSEHLSEICGKNWLTNFFFWQNNIRPISQICFPHTWSIAVEYQLLPLIILLIHLYKRSPRIAITINITIIIVDFIYMGIVIFIFNVQPHDLSRAFNPKEIVKLHETLLRSQFHVWIYLSSPLWAYLINNQIWKTIKLGKKFILIVLALHGLPIIWIGLSDYDGPVLNSIYWVIYRLVNLSFYTCIVRVNCEQLRNFFAHPNDPIDNNQRKSQSIINFDSDNYYRRFLHFTSTLLRSSYYVHMCVIIFYYNYQRTAVSSIKIFIFFVLELMILSLIGGFIFHLFVANPVSSLFSSTLTRQKENNKQKPL